MRLAVGSHPRPIAPRHGRSNGKLFHGPEIRAHPGAYPVHCGQPRRSAPAKPGDERRIVQRVMAQPVRLAPGNGDERFHLTPEPRGRRGGSPMNASTLSAVFNPTELPRLSRWLMKPRSPSANSPNCRALIPSRLQYTVIRSRNVLSKETSKSPSESESIHVRRAVMAPKIEGPGFRINMFL